MSFWKTGIRPLCAALMLLCAGSVYAASHQAALQSDDYVAVERKKRYSETEYAEEYTRRQDIVQRANQIFTLLGGEMALEKGEAGTALATYMLMLDRTRDPEVAERAMEMAVSLHAYEQAEAIYQKWQQIEPVPGPAQKRMTWARSLVFGDTKYAADNLAAVFAGADEEQVRRMFLLLTQVSVQQPDLAAKAGSALHRTAAKYPDMPEAAIADAIFSAQNGKDKNAVKALQKLAGLDADIRPPTELTLRLVAQRRPEVLNRFFAETDTKDLSPMWQELKISSLISAGQTDEAYRQLQQLLAQSPNADLYIQAALLGVQRNDDLSAVIGQLEKAYAYGTQEQQSRAAVIAAMRTADARQYAEAKAWLNKINAPDYVFDKAVLRASIEAEQGNWQQALAETRRAQRLPEQQGRFFNGNDLQRVQLFAIAKHSNPQQALAELNTMLARAEKQPDNDERVADILYQRALVYADKLRQPERAVADLRRYLKLNQNSAGGMNALGYTMLSQPSADLDEAFGLIQAAYQIEPESAAINDSMGWAYFKKGDPQAALPYLQYAFEQYPDPEVAAHLGEVLWATGEHEQARAVFAKGLAGEGNMAVLRETIKRLGVRLPAASNAKK